MLLPATAFNIRHSLCPPPRIPLLRRLSTISVVEAASCLLAYVLLVIKYGRSRGDTQGHDKVDHEHLVLRLDA